MNEPPRTNRTKVYFASDFHLGTPTWEESRERERRIVRWLDSIKDNAAEIYLLGDVFDFWFEYRYVVPKGFVRFLGKLGELSDSGIRIHFFCGNHDLWLRSYFEQELGIIVHHKSLTVQLSGKTFFLGHGDGLDKSDVKYRIINKVFTSKVCISAFGAIHPRWAVSLGYKLSGKSRMAHSESDKISLVEYEPIYRFCLSELRNH